MFKPSDVAYLKSSNFNNISFILGIGYGLIFTCLFRFLNATSLGLNMGYYHIQPSDNASHLCRIIIPGKKYRYKRLPMGVANSPDIFQQKMNDLFNGFEFICAYIEDLLVLTEGDCKYHVQKLKSTLNKLKEKGLKCNIENYFLRQT